MKFSRACIAVLMTTVCSVANAEIDFERAEGLASICRSKQPIDDAFCAGLILGMLEGSDNAAVRTRVKLMLAFSKEQYERFKSQFDDAADVSCIPTGTSFGEVVAVVRAKLTARKWKEQFSTIAVHSLIAESYPCKKE